MKDVVSCDKLRVGANNFKSGDFRMGQPSPGYAGLLPPEYIGWVEPTGRTDTSKYPQEEKILMISPVAASEQETAQTRSVFLRQSGGCGTRHKLLKANQSVLESRSIEGDRPVGES